MADYEHFLSVDATIIVSKNCPIIGVHMCLSTIMASCLRSVFKPFMIGRFLGEF